MKPTPASQGTLEGFLHRGLAAQRAVDEVIAKFLTRHTDPWTSKAAARELVRSDRLTAQQNASYAILRTYGPGTAKEIAARFVTDFPDAAVPTVYHKLCRRLPELQRKGRAEVVKGEVRDGCRVWRAIGKE